MIIQLPQQHRVVRLLPNFFAVVLVSLSAACATYGGNPIEVSESELDNFNAVCTQLTGTVHPDPAHLTCKQARYTEWLAGKSRQAKDASRVTEAIADNLVPLAKFAIGIIFRPKSTAAGAVGSVASEIATAAEEYGRGNVGTNDAVIAGESAITDARMFAKNGASID